MSRVSRLIVLAGGVYVALCGPLLASKICVTVNDEADRFIAGATVGIADLAQPDSTVSIVTDGEGKACSDDLPVGLYDVEAGADKFLNVRYYPVDVARTGVVRLTFWLPVSLAPVQPQPVEAAESTLLGTLPGNPWNIRICLFKAQNETPVGCSTTDLNGEYALAVPPDVYRIEMGEIRSETIRTFTVDLSEARVYEDLLSFREGELLRRRTPADE